MFVVTMSFDSFSAEQIVLVGVGATRAEAGSIRDKYESQLVEALAKARSGGFILDTPHSWDDDQKKVNAVLMPLGISETYDGVPSEIDHRKYEITDAEQLPRGLR